MDLKLQPSLLQEHDVGFWVPDLQTDAIQHDCMQIYTN